jgi:hypothetical protein
VKRKVGLKIGLGLPVGQCLSKDLIKICTDLDRILAGALEWLSELRSLTTNTAYPYPMPGKWDQGDPEELEPRP